MVKISKSLLRGHKLFDTLTNLKNIEPQNGSVTRARGYKTFFLLNSLEHEISNAHKYKNIKKFSFFSDSNKSRMLFFLLINVKMPTIVGILTFYQQEKFLAKLS